LADAYYDRENKIDRLLENEETCYQLKDVWTNIMESTREKIQMKANDIEMMLLAYGLSFEPQDLIPKLVQQYYNNYKFQGETYTLSSAIKNKKDREKERETR
jgi:hypothetical protein